MRKRRSITSALMASLTLAAMATPAAADNEPVIVVPGRPGVPVMMYGVDVSGAVIEGEWGLNRPGVVAPTVIMPFWPQNVYPTAGAYFPVTGHRPPYGRLERIPPPNRRLPTPAQPFYREWMSVPDPGPVTMPLPYDPQPIVVAPQINQRRAHTPAPRSSWKTP